VRRTTSLQHPDTAFVFLGSSNRTGQECSP
jgi:hypothetical protein